MSLEFILQLAYSTCYNCLSSGLIDRDSDSFLSTPWTYEDGWKLLLHDTYYTTSSTTQNTLSSYLSKLQNDPHSIFTFVWKFFREVRPTTGLRGEFGLWVSLSASPASSDVGLNHYLCQ